MVTFEQRQYGTYIVRSPRAVLEVVPERGGIVTRWQVDGQELFYLDEERFRDPSLSVRGGNPILFPICGNLPENSYTVGGQAYTLKQHGFARELSWAGSSSSNGITVTLQSSDRTRPHYPFEFLVSLTYGLTDTPSGSALTVQQTFTNHSEVPMPFAVGFHPYFAIADKNSLHYTIPASQCWNNVLKAVEPYNGTLDLSQPELDLAFTPLSEPRLQFQYDGKTLDIATDAAFRTFVFWTVQGKDFVCLEPWTAPRNALNTGEDLLHLAPGQSQSLEVTFTASCPST
ncbi:MAG: aldose epimerase [Oscillatoriales cyanobacterium SM2_2_1]|nr:aldose epimerase [Oscillatoriales cyanobacterium SM2_2_1]